METLTMDIMGAGMIVAAALMMVTMLPIHLVRERNKAKE